MCEVVPFGGENLYRSTGVTGSLYTPRSHLSFHPFFAIGVHAIGIPAIGVPAIDVPAVDVPAIGIPAGAQPRSVVPFQPPLVGNANAVTWPLLLHHSMLQI